MSQSSFRRALAVFAALVALVAAPATARGSDGTCPPSVRTWVTAAGRAAAVETRLETCAADRVVFWLEPVGWAPLGVEVARSDLGAFVSVAGLGISPLLTIDDFHEVPAPRREPFERLVQWVRDHPDRVSFGGVLPAPLVAIARPTATAWAAPWLLIVALMLGAIGVGHHRPLRQDAAALGTIFGVSIPLRVVFGAWGPLRINGLAPLWIMAAAVDPREAAAYGPGYAEVFGLVARHTPVAPDLAVAVANILLSSSVPVLVVALARLLGVDFRRACVAGLVVALDPISIRIAATESYIPVIEALVGAAAVSFALAGRLGSKRVGWRSGAIALAGALLAAQAARVHPAAWLPVAMAPLATGAVDLPWRRRVTLGGAAVALCGALVVLTSGRQLLHAYDCMLSGETMRPGVTIPVLDARAVAVLALLGLLLWIARPRGPMAIGIVALSMVVLTERNYAQSALWEQAYLRLYAIPIAVAAAALVPGWLARGRGFMVGAAVVLTANLAVRRESELTPRTTDHEEYRWARHQLAALPRECDIAYVAFAGHRNLFLPTYGARPEAIRRLDGRMRIDARDALGPLACTFYIRTSLCTSAEGRDRCDRLEAQLVLEPVARASFAAAPSNDELAYDRPIVETVISRARGYRDDVR